MKTPPTRMLIIGDSVALGVTHLVGNDIRELAARDFVQQLSARCESLHIDCDAAVQRTTTQALTLLQDLLKKYQPQIVLFSLGGSDADINWKRFIIAQGRRIQHNTPLEQFENNLRCLVQQTHAFGASALLSSLPEEDLDRRGQFLSDVTGVDVKSLIAIGGGQAEADRRYHQYADTITRVARETGAIYADWTARVRALPQEQRVGPDAIHPGDEAHTIIADTLADLLSKKLSCLPSVPLAATRS